MNEAPALWTNVDAAQATGGRSSTFWRANGISIDSRSELSEVESAPSVAPLPRANASPSGSALEDIVHSR